MTGIYLLYIYMIVCNILDIEYCIWDTLMFHFIYKWEDEEFGVRLRDKCTNSLYQEIKESLLKVRVILAFSVAS